MNRLVCLVTVRSAQCGLRRVQSVDGEKQNAMAFLTTVLLTLTAGLARRPCALVQKKSAEIKIRFNGLGIFLKPFAVIPVRLDSRRFPNKPMAEIEGTPMLARLIDSIRGWTCLKA